MDTRTARLDRLAQALLYVCVDARRGQGDLLEFAESVLSSGLDLIQLRDKSDHNPLEALDEIAALESIARITRAHGALLAVNDRADIAATVDADVLHLGQRDLPTSVARRIAGTEILLGRSTHTVSQAKEAINDPHVDYFCVGPCWATPTKPGRTAVGLELVHEVAALAPKKPWFAIGGIDLKRLQSVMNAGASRVVVVRAVTDAISPADAVREFRSRLSVY